MLLFVLGVVIILIGVALSIALHEIGHLVPAKLFGVKHALDSHWFLFGSAGASQLLGPAADSPLVEKRGGYGASVGVAWRN